MLFMSQAELIPTDLALRMRNPFLVSLLALAGIAICKVVISDYWGAINTLLVVVMGFFVIAGEYSVNASSALLYSVMAVISGIFDAISCVLYFQHSKYEMFQPKAPGIIILAQATFVSCPLVLFVSATIAYAIFSDCRDQAAEAFEQQQQHMYGSMGWGSPSLATGSPRSQHQQAQRTVRATQHLAPIGGPPPFQGQGKRLGAVLAEYDKRNKDP